MKIKIEVDGSPYNIKDFLRSLKPMVQRLARTHSLKCGTIEREGGNITNG